MGDTTGPPAGKSGIIRVSFTQKDLQYVGILVDRESYNLFGGGIK